MGKEKLLSEKTPTLHLDKNPFDHGNERGKFACSRPMLLWILGLILVVLLILVTILFLYSPFEAKIIIQEEPIEVQMITPKLENGGNHQGNSKNPWDFDFLINPINLCATVNPPNSVEYQSNPEVKLLILVPSTVDHFEQRRAIRNTWGSVAERPLGPMRLGFVLGTTTNKSTESLILAESSAFRDIIQIDFVDSYQQLTTKSILMLKWVAKMCPHAQYFLKTEDDTFVNVHSIAEILNKEPYISKERFIGGHIKNIEKPLKLPRTEIQLTVSENSLVDFPPYASSSYVMTIPTAIDLFGAAKEVEPHFQEDDAFLTGLCAKHLDVPLFHESSFIIDDPPMPPLWDTYSSIATAHSVSPDALQEVWNDMAKSIANSMFYFENAINNTGRFRSKKSI